jgi:phage recombination protein Bet
MKKKQKSSQEVAIKTSKKVLIKEPQTMWTQEQVELIKNTVAKGATDDELKLFLYTARRTGLDPLTKQIHFVKRGGQMTIQTGIDGYRAIAERTGELAGITDPLYEVEGDKPIKAIVKVYRSKNGMMAEFAASARFTEYVAYGPLWQKMPYLMLGKCAEALALRKAFPNDLSGLYTNEEMAQAESKPILPIKIQPESFQRPTEEVIDITPEPEKPQVSNKTKIAYLTKQLKITDSIPEKIKAITGLEFIEDNYSEIISRLEVIYKESKENK